MSPPSLRALQAFAETARTGSLAAASRALNVTPSAVSHLLRELEQSLALSLFVASGPNARLTEAGEDSAAAWPPLSTPSTPRSPRRGIRPATSASPPCRVFSPSGWSRA